MDFGFDAPKFNQTAFMVHSTVYCVLHGHTSVMFTAEEFSMLHVEAE